MSTTEVKKSSSIVIPARLSYLHVWAPHAMKPTDKAKYRAALLIDKKDTATVAKIQKAIEEAKELGKTRVKDWAGKIPKVLKEIFRDGDAEKDDPNYAGHYFINATSDYQPGVLDSNKEEMLDKTKLYSGCFAKVDINFYGYYANGSAGIACGLNNIMKVKDGPSLAGKRSATEAFKDEEAEDDGGL